MITGDHSIGVQAIHAYIEYLGVTIDQDLNGMNTYRLKPCAVCWTFSEDRIAQENKIQVFKRQTKYYIQIYHSTTLRLLPNSMGLNGEKQHKPTSKWSC